MQRWEYQILDREARISVGTRHALTSWGEQGWELVCAQQDGSLIFKRPLPSPMVERKAS